MLMEGPETRGSARRRHTIRTYLWGWVLLVSCSREPSDLTVLPGAIVDYRHSPELTPCGGNLAEVNEFVEYTAAAMGVPLEDLSSLSFSWVSPEDLQAWTSSCTDSCAVGTSAFSIRPMINHELAHALIYHVNSNAPDVLSEGFATAMHLLHVSNYEAASPRDPRELLEVLDLATGFYLGAGLFVSYLIQRFGAEKFKDLYARLQKGASRADWDGALTDIYGASVDGIVEDYLAATDCPAAEIPFPPYGCDAAPLSAQDGGWQYVRTLRCDDPDVIGGADSPEGFAVTTVTLDVESEGDYDVILLEPSDVKALVTIGECDGCRWLPKVVALGQGQARRATLAAGRHVMAIHLFEGDAREFHLSITPAQ